MITVNLTKAKEVSKETLRVKRRHLLEEQDVLYMIAQEAGDDTTAIVAEKQRLRDITDKADECKDTTELKELLKPFITVT